MLYAGNLGMNLAGYYSSADELHPDAHPYSNAHEMFLINSDTVDLRDNYIYGTMAHEFQHMIHWYQDRNEETWVNEGFSMLAEHVNNYDAGGFDWEYMDNTDMQLNDWGGDVGDNGPHYGASYIFFVYFLDRFGDDATKALVRHDENGFTGIEKVMEELDLVNPTTEKPYTANEFFADWAVANLLQDTSIENGRYGYLSYSPTYVDMEKSVMACPTKLNGDVYQYGVDYIEIDCGSLDSIQITASEAVRLLPFNAPSSGDYFIWSNVGDESNSHLSQTFDLSQVSGEAALTFKTWYDIEEDYDYIYISASTDGQTWRILDSESGTSDNPSGNSYGCGWNGTTTGWIDEKVDLSDYVGQTVTLRFDYVTDAAVNGKGMAIDDLAIDAIGYSTDLETDLGGWTAEGFVRVQNHLPQTMNLTIVTYTNNGISVDHRSFQGDLVIPASELPSDSIEKIVLIISGTTPFTRKKQLTQSISDNGHNAQKTEAEKLFSLCFVIVGLHASDSVHQIVVNGEVGQDADQVHRLTHVLIQTNQGKVAASAFFELFLDADDGPPTSTRDKFNVTHVDDDRLVFFKQLGQNPFDVRSNSTIDTTQPFNYKRAFILSYLEIHNHLFC